MADDIVERLTGHPRIGFEPDVCTGCPFHGDPPLRRCGKCGCPTVRYFPMDQLGAPPPDCIRKDEHERRG